MGTRAQESITLYLTQMGYDPDVTYLRYDESCVIVETPRESKRLTVNAYEDILEVMPDGSKVVIAESNIHHKKGAGRATSWTKKEDAAE